MEDFLKLVTGSLTIGAIVIFLGKLIINRGFDAALKNFQNKLDLLKIEHQIKYSKLHEERATILKNLYQELYSLEKALAYLTTAFQGEEWLNDNERKDKAVSRLNYCKEILEGNRIFFPEQFCEELSKVLDDCQQIIADMDRAKIKGRAENRFAERGRRFGSDNEENSLEMWIRQEKKVNTEIKAKRIQLANSFRKIIGSDAEN